MAKLEIYDGHIIYKEKDLKKYKNQLFFKNELGYLFQNFGLLDSHTIEENLDLGLVGKKVGKQEKRNLQKDVLKQVGLAYLDVKQKIFTLSGGGSTTCRFSQNYS